MVSQLGYIVPDLKDISWNFIRQVLIGKKSLIKIHNDSTIIELPK